MEFNDYQKLAESTAIYSNRGHNVIYPTLGLAGEAGEVAEKIKKVQRDHGGIIDSVRKEEIKKELGDVLWYVSQLALEIGVSLQEVVDANLDKLSNRKLNNTLHGNGDNR